MKARWIILPLLLGMISIVSLTLADEKGNEAVLDRPGVAVNKLDPVGNEQAPEATAVVMHTVSGSDLEFVLISKNLTADKTYKITSCDKTLAEGKTDSSGKLVIKARVTDADTLKTISDDAKRKFSLWQDNHRLSWSENIYEFNYSKN